MSRRARRHKISISGGRAHTAPAAFFRFQKGAAITVPSPQTTLYGEDAAVLHRDEECTVYRFSAAGGEVRGRSREWRVGLRLLRLKRPLGVNFPKEKRGLPLNSS